MSNQWDTYASIYNEGIGFEGEEALHKNIIDPLILRYLQNYRGLTILDVGCGNGYLLRKLAHQAHMVVGLDSSRKLLSIARRNTVGLKNLSLDQGDITKTLPYANATFHTVIANMVLQYVPKLEKFAQESARVLKDGGNLIVIVDPPGRTLYVRAQELAGKKSEKFLTSASYFTSGKRTKKSLWGKAILEYYHRPTEDYINPFTPYFHLDTMTELTEDGEMPRIFGLKWIKRKMKP